MSIFYTKTKAKSTYCHEVIIEKKKISSKYIRYTTKSIWVLFLYMYNSTAAYCIFNGVKILL